MADTLQPVGVRMKIENLEGFLGGVLQADKVVVNFGKQATKAAGSESSKTGIAGMGAVMGIAAGVAMAALNAFAGITRSIGGMASAAFNNATELQNLTISLESLAAREQLATGAADDMNEALSQAGPIAQDLLEKIRDLSVASPFEYKDVVSVFRLNMAFGQTADTSLKLTKAITDIAAASGQGGYIMQRLAYNFSQMSMTGQVTMRDIRDLAMAGFDLAKVFKDELQMSVEDVNNALKAGELTMQDVSNAFVEYADKNFGGAAERMSRTITGVVSSLHDLAFFASTDILGGALNNIGTALANLFDRARAITDSGVLQVVGVVFEVLTSRAAEASERLPKITEDTLVSMGDKFMAFTENAFDYGLNIMVQFAYGIIDGASFVVDAVLWVVGAIANLLMPGSPPKALPDIDKWGTNTFLEYLRGFTEADFGVLKNIQRPIREALSLLDITGPKAAAMYGGFSQAIAKMLTTGTIDQGVFNTMAKSLGKYGAEIAKLAKQETELALAMRAVDNARKAEQNAWTDLQKKVYAYNRAVKEGADESTLAGLRAQVDTAEATFETASAEREATEEKYQNIDAMKEQVDIQREIVNQLLDIARMQKMAALKGAGGGGAGGLALPAPPGGGLSAVTSAWEKKISEFRDRLKAKFDTAMTELGKHFAESSVGKLLAAIKQALFGGTTTQGIENQPWLLLPGMEGILNIPESKLAGLQRLLEIVTGQTVDLSVAQKVLDFVNGLFSGLSKIFTPEMVKGIGLVVGGIAAFGIILTGAQIALALVILGLIGKAIMWIIDTIKLLIDKIKESLPQITVILNGMKDLFAETFKNIKKIFIDPFIKGLGGIITAIVGVIGKIKEFVGYILSGQFGKALEMLRAFIANSPAPMAVGLDQIGKGFAKLKSQEMPALASAINGLARPVAPAYSSGNTYNMPVTVNASVSGNTDIHQLAYVIAREMNQRMNR